MINEPDEMILQEAQRTISDYSSSPALYTATFKLQSPQRPPVGGFRVPPPSRSHPNAGGWMKLLELSGAH